jgi:NAD-dependent SIR2 family protein deacetylase
LVTKGGFLADRAIERARALLRSADAIVVAAGAGMGADCGLPTFRGDGGFWKAYPALGRRGLSFAAVASPGTFERDPGLAWAFYGHRLALYRATPPHDGYRLLADLALRAELGAFVVTTNVDGHFLRGGFPAGALWEMHGSIHRLQCLEPCHAGTWPADGFEPRVDVAECRLLGEPPRCPACGGLARPNVLMFGDWSWVADPADAQERRFDAFAARASRPVVIEIGAGTAIPSLRLLSRRRRWPVVRVNPDEAEVADGEGVALRMNALEALRELIAD